MEVFRRLRSRRKSKGQAESFTSFADAESGYRSGSGPWQTSTTRSPVTATRPGDAERKVSHDQSSQPKSPAEHRLPASSSRVQPLLIGISRPSMTVSRPGTAGSMQKALDQAAESVSHQPFQSPASPTSQSGLRTNRYVDIFAISGQTSQPTTTFNEDVAERNLDTVALTVEEQHFRYAPMSKYQEEVAARNAHQIAAQRVSSLCPTGPELTKSSETRPKSAQSGSYLHQAQTNTESPKTLQSQDVSAYHSRQSITRNRDAPKYLPAIPQERSSEDFGLAEKKMNTTSGPGANMQRVSRRWLEARGQPQRDVSPNTDKPLPAEPIDREQPRDSGISSYSSPVNRASDLSDIQQVRRSRQESLKSSNQGSDRQSSSFVQPNSSVESKARPGLSASRSSYKRVYVGNRTIMDLTTDESTEAISVASYRQTPVIEDVRADAFRRVMPTVIDHSPPEKAAERDPVVPGTRWSSALEPVLDLDQLARQSQFISETAKAAVAQKSLSEAAAPFQQRARTPPSTDLAFSPIQTLTSSSPPRTITFSPINTLTSTSPRSSREVLFLQKAGPDAMASSKSSTSNSLPSGDRLQLPPSDVATSRSTARISANIEPMMKVFADLKPEGEEGGRLTTASGSNLVRSGSGKQRPTKTSGSSTKKEGKKRETSNEAKAARRARSIVPAGPLDREPMPGVKTRDFAMVPLDKPTNKRIEALSERKWLQSSIEAKKSSREPSSSSKSSSSERKSRSKPSKPTVKVSFEDNPVSSSTSMPKPEKKSEKKSSKKGSKQSSSAARKTRPMSIFDEKAFQKKHAEANAALLRLQQSLQDSLDESQPDSPERYATPVVRILTPASSAVHRRSPIAQSSPSKAAIAMIAAATSSSKTRSDPNSHAKAGSDLGQKPATSSRPAAAVRATTQDPVATYLGSGLSSGIAVALNPLLARIDGINKPPPSPGEVSLSSFPIPTPRAMSPESGKNPPAYVKDIGSPVRRGSQASRTSAASAFSIPFTMVPNRLASLPEKRLGIPGPSTQPQTDFLDSIVPPA